MKAAIKLLGSFFFCLVMMGAEAAPLKFYTIDQPVIWVSADQPTFSIKLAANPTTGYAWYLQRYDVALIQPVKRVYEAPLKKNQMGAPGYEIWTFRVKPAGFAVPMQTRLQFVYARAWEVNEKAQPVVFQVTTQIKKE
ncbi:MAG TPA: protease inhibitor I42 family protein [Gammaproteobacteria bacterium]|nr:protease inhibitor I42 family protein [Gammaproteobacteria bacterium]